MTVQKWGGLASYLMVVAFVAGPLIYVMGNLREPLGPLGYDIADFMYGPLLGASLLTAVFSLREYIGERASRRMDLSLLAAALAAAAFVGAACIRSANRHYHLIHPELHLEMNSDVLVVWTTLVAGVLAAAHHFLGWSLLLLGSAGWTSRALPRGLSGLYLLCGAAALFVYLKPDLEGMVALLALAWGTWQGILLWKAARGAPPGAPKPN